MDNTAQILAEIKDINKNMTKIEVAQARMEASNLEQHKALGDKIATLTKNSSASYGRTTKIEGRVTKLEHFKTTISTSIKTIPATISFLVALTGGLITWAALAL